MQGFDVKAAKAAGYSDDEILGHLTSTRKFDVDGASKAGYSKPEIIDHLAGLETVHTSHGASGSWAPEPATPGSLARQFGGGALESLGVDLESPILGTVRNIKNGLMDVGRRNFPTPEQFFAHPEQRGLNTEALKGLVAAPVETYHGIKEGDLNKVAHGAGGTLGSIAPFVLGNPEARATAGTAIEKVGRLPVRAGEAVVSKAADLVTGTPLQPRKAMVKAIKPRAGNLQFESSLDRSMPELKNVERMTGRPITTLDELIDGTKIGKKEIWKQYERIQGPQAQRGLSGNDVATAIDKSIPLKTKIQNPKMAEKLQAIAGTYRNRTFKVSELEDLLHTTNAELDSFYDKYPTAKRTLADRSPDTAHLVAEGKALRNTIYKALDEAGGGAAPRELKQRYGSLLNLEEEAYRRRNVAARQQPESLTEQMGRLHAGFKVAKGALQIFPGLDPAGGISEIGSAVAGRKLGRMIKEANSTDRLIKVAMERYKGMPSPVDYTPVRPKALLGRGAFQMGEVPSEGIKVETVPWESMRPPVRKALPSAVTDLRATVKYGPTGPYEMPPAPPKLLTSGQKMLPERAGGPHVTPLVESLIEKVRRMQKRK